MTYTIQAVKLDGETLITTVEYTVGKETVTLDVSHFQPQTEADIALGIVNMSATLDRKFSAVETCKQLAASLKIGDVVEVA